MTTHNGVNTSLNGQTGTGSFVGSNAPTFTGTIIASSIQFSPSTNGLIGTTTNNNAAPGYVGEFISSEIDVGSAISLSTGISANITSISLTTGDWNISAFGATTVGAGTLTPSLVFSTSLTSNTIEGPSIHRSYAAFDISNIGANSTYFLSLSTTRLSLSATTTVYLVCSANFSVSTCSAYGWISATRFR